MLRIETTIKAAHKQWFLMLEDGIDEQDAYALSNGDIPTRYDKNAYSHFCDYDSSKNESEDCRLCPAYAMWGDGTAGGGCLSAPNSQYDYWMKNNDAEPMVKLIEQVARKFSVILPTEY